MIKILINIINIVALGLGIYWAYKNNFGAEQLISILAPLSTLLTLNFDKFKFVIIQKAKVRGDGNRTLQDASGNNFVNQDLDIQGNYNEQNQK